MRKHTYTFALKRKGNAWEGKKLDFCASEFSTFFVVPPEVNKIYLNISEIEPTGTNFITSILVRPLSDEYVLAFVKTNKCKATRTHYRMLSLSESLEKWVSKKFEDAYNVYAWVEYDD